MTENFLYIDVKHSLSDFRLEAKVTIPNGITAVFGRSGAGKSTLINLIAGLTTAQQGKIIFNQRILFDDSQKYHLAPEKRHIGYVFQEPRLFPHYCVRDNLNYGCKRSNSAKFLQLVELLGISHLLERFPNSLSGGEKQRVAIGRALLTDPDILLMDEPLSALDLPRKQELLNYLSKLAKSLSIPILYVTHSLDEVIRLADRILLLEKGKIIAYGSVAEIWRSPQFSAWQPYAQKITLLELPLIEMHPIYHMQCLAINSQKIWIGYQPHYQIGDLVRITIGSKDVSITLEQPINTSIRNILSGSICVIEQDKECVNILVQVEQQQIWATISLWSANELNLTIGKFVFLQIKAISL